MKHLLLAAALLLAPAIAFAQDGAGFATQTVFLSHTPVKEGETVSIYASVSNQATTSFIGKVVFSEGSGQIGSVNVTLEPEEARIVSLSWKPTAGIHRVITTLESSAGAEIASQSTEFSIQPKPVKSTSLPGATVDSSQGIQQTLADISPTTASVAAPAFSSIDTGRQALANGIDSQIANAHAHLPGAVLGAETQKAPKPSGAAGWATTILWTLYFYILTVLRFLVGKAALFYPILAVVFMYILYRLYRRMTRPAYY